MSRYIDAEILSDALRHLTLGETDAARATMKITHYVSRMPTADVVEVVRCKDCKHYAGEGMYCACDIMVHYDHFYCYWGERVTT